MSKLSPLAQRPLFRGPRLPFVAASVSVLALMAASQTASAQSQQPAGQAQAQPTGQPAGGQVTIRPIDVTAAKPKKAKKRPGPLAAGAAQQAAPVQAATGPVKVQEKTQLGRLTVATPLNGSVIDKAQIDAVRPADVQRELLPQIPGVSMVRNLRIPIGGKGYTNNLVDGYSMKSSSLGNMSHVDEMNTRDMEAIEVTRGPASVLYNSKGVGGTINVITRDPTTSKPEVGVWGDTGTYAFKRAGAHASGANEQGTLGVFIDGNYMKEDGWRDRSAREKESISGKFVMKPDADTKVTFRSEYVDSYREYPGSITEAQFNSNWRQPFANNLYEDLHFYTTLIDVKRNIGKDGELTLAYSDHKNWGVNACTAGCSNAATSKTRETDLDYTDDNYRAVFRQDFGFLKSRVYVGMDAFISEKKDDTYSRTNFTRGSLVSAYTVDETNLAPFAQYEFSPLDRLRVTLGVREEMYDMTVNDRSPKTNKDGSKEYDSLVRKAGVTYEYANNHFLWGNVAEGFYVPATGSTITATNPTDLPPETSLTYGIGIRGKLTEQKLTYDIGLYQSIIQDQAVTMNCNGDKTVCTGDATGTYSVAAGEVEFRGMETAVSWRPIDFLKIDVAHTYALNTYVDFNERGVDYSGNYLSSSPKHHVNARATVYPVPGLSVGLEADYISDYFTDSANTDTYQRPVLFNMRMAYDTGYGMELWGNIYNLFDVKYAERVSLSSSGRIYSEGYHPLTVRGGISYKW